MDLWSIDFFTRISKQLNGAKIVFSRNSARTTDIHMQKKEADPHLAPYPKINSLCNPNIKMDYISKCKSQTIKHLKENTGGESSQTWIW